MSAIWHEQEFTYRTSQYTPQAPVAGFINFLSKQYYQERDEETIEMVRQAIGEFTNDPQVRLASSVFSNKQHGKHESLMNEQYVAYTNAGVKMFSLSIVSGDDLEFPSAVEMPTTGLHIVKRANERGYACSMCWDGQSSKQLALQFVSIYHQLRNLVCFLSDRCKFYIHYDPKSEKYFVFGRPLDQATKKDEAGQPKEEDRFQVLISIIIPAVLTDVNVS